MKRHPWRRTGWWAAAALVLGAGVAAAWLAFAAEHKLATLALGGLGESFSTRVWSAPYRLPDGARAETARLLERLDRLGYRRVDGPPGLGEYRWSPPELAVGLRGFRLPFASQGEGTYLLRREDDGAWRLSDGLGAPVQEIFLEPELVAELSGARRQRREPLDWAHIPPVLRNAVVSAEDKRFWTHWGLDPRAILRALRADALGRDLQGASTITQQLSKNLFLSPRRTLTRKLEEAGLAVYLEMRLDKRRILTLYLNDIYMGQEGHSSLMGMRAAARHYFGKNTGDLTLPEAAALAGMIRGPGLYQDPAACTLRRDWVLRRMREDGYIGEGELLDALATPVVFAPVAARKERADGAYAYYAAEVVRRLLPRYGEDVLYRNGLSIYTLMDPVLQEDAQKILAGAPHQAALVALDPSDGRVLALAGGRSYARSQFNRATQALRQPGSAFKPFVYAAAIKAGLTPATLLTDRPRRYPAAGGSKAWAPVNYDEIYYGTVTMREALARSLNSATLDLAQRVGLPRIVETARECGIMSPLRGDLGLALGDSEVNLLDLTAAYEPFAAQGRRAPPRLIAAVLDADGAVLEAPLPESEPVLDPAVAYVMTSLMESVVKEGTARNLASLGWDGPAAGKTGTTNDGRDAWFVGYTDSTLAGVWVGDDRNRALKLLGARSALPLWAKFMIEAAADRPPQPFVRPPGVVEVRICAASGMLARSGCPVQHKEVFVAGTEPRRECILHRGGFAGWLDRLFKR